MAGPTRRTPAPRVHRGELLSATSALLLLLIMFLLSWYDVVAFPGRSSARSGISSAENAWRALTLVRWLMLLTIGVALGSVVLHATQRSHGSETHTGIVVALLGTITAALLAYRVLIAFPTPNQVVDQKLGAILGLLCAIGIALGGYESIREERARLVQESRARPDLARRAGAR